MDIEQTLTSIGLSKNEIKTYVALTKHGPLSALENSKHTGIHRSNSYDVLHSLMEKGFVSQIIDGSRAVFNAREPDVLNDYIKQKEEQVEDVVKELRELSHSSPTGEGVVVSTGVFSVRETLREIFEDNKEIKIYGINNRVMDILEKGFFKRIYEDRLKREFPTKVIYNANKIHCNLFLMNKFYKNVRFLPERYEGEVVTFLYAQRVVLLVFSEMPLVISIGNQMVHDSYDKYFEILWSKAKQE